MERKHIVLFLSVLLVQQSSSNLASLFENVPASDPVVDPAPQPVITEPEKPKTSLSPDSTISTSSLDQPVHDPPSALGVLGNDMTFPDPPSLDPMSQPSLPPQDFNNFGPDPGQPELSQLATELGLDFNFFTDPITPSDSSSQAGASSLFTSNTDPASPSISSVNTPVDKAPGKQIFEMTGSSSVAAPPSGVNPSLGTGAFEKSTSLSEMIGSSSPTGDAPPTETGISPFGVAVDPIQDNPVSLSDVMGPSAPVDTAPPTGIDLSPSDPVQVNTLSLGDMMGSSSASSSGGLSLSTMAGPINPIPMEMPVTSGGLSRLVNSGDTIQSPNDHVQANSMSLSDMMGSSSTSLSDGLSLSDLAGPIDPIPKEMPVTSGGLGDLMNSGDTIQASLPPSDPSLETEARRQQLVQVNENPGASPFPLPNIGMPRSVSDPAFRLPSSGLISPQVNSPSSGPFGQLPETPEAGQPGSNQLPGGFQPALPQGPSAGRPFPFGFPGGMMGDPRFGFPSPLAGSQTDQSATPSAHQPTPSLQDLQPNTEPGQQTPQGTRSAQPIPGQPPFDPRMAGMFPPFIPPGFAGFQPQAANGQAPGGSSLPSANAQTAQTDSTPGHGNQQMLPQAPMIPPFMNPALLHQNIQGARQPSNPTQTTAPGASPGNAQTNLDALQLRRNQPMLPQAAMIPPFMNPALLPQNVPGARQPSNPTQTTAPGAAPGGAQTNPDPSQVRRNQLMLPQAPMFPGMMPPFLPPRFPGLGPHASPAQSSVPGVPDSQVRRPDPSLQQRPPALLPPGFPTPQISDSGEPVNRIQPESPIANIPESSQTNQADSSLLPRAEQVLREVENLVSELRSSARPGLKVRPPGTGYCPNGRRRAACDVNPCDEVTCLNILDAKCRPACDHCGPTFHVRERRGRGGSTIEKDVTDICMTVRWGRGRPGEEATTPSTPIEPRGPFIDGPPGRRPSIPDLPRPRRDPDGRPILLNPEDSIIGQSQVPQIPRRDLFPRGLPRFPIGSPLDPRIPPPFRGLPRLPPSMLDPRLSRRGMRARATAGGEQGSAGRIVLPEIANLIRAGRLDGRGLGAIRVGSVSRMAGLRPQGLSARTAVSDVPSRTSDPRNEIEQAVTRFERQTSRRSL